MSKRAVEKFLYRFDKDEALTAAFKADPKAALAGLELEPADPELRSVLASAEAD